MIKRNILLFVMLLILPIIFASQDYSPGDNVTITVSCYNADDDSACISANCNITKLTNPLGQSLISSQEAMTNSYDHIFIYSLTAPSLIGQYNYEAYCITSTDKGFSEGNFQVTYNRLSSESYAIYLNNIELFTKGGIFVMLILWAFIRIRRQKKLEKTPYYLIGVIRMMTITSAYIVIFLSPLLGLFLFHPNFNIGIVQRFTLTTYIIIFALATPVFLVNLFYFSGTSLMKLMGLDVDKERTNKVLNDLDKFSKDMISYKTKITNKIFRG